MGTAIQMKVDGRAQRIAIHSIAIRTIRVLQKQMVAQVWSALLLNMKIGLTEHEKIVLKLNVMTTM